MYDIDRQCGFKCLSPSSWVTYLWKALIKIFGSKFKELSNGSAGKYNPEKSPE